VLDRSALAPAFVLAGQLDDERHVHGLVVEKHAVLLLAVIPQAFTVIREQHDRRLVEQLLGA
jgi:hypothetical protein